MPYEAGERDREDLRGIFRGRRDDLSFPAMLPGKTRLRLDVLTATALAFGFPATARADAGIAMLPVRYPAILWFLLLVIAVEMIYLQGAVGKRWKRAVPAVVGTNVLAMAIGFPLVWALYRGLDMALRFPRSQVDLLTYREWGPVWVCGRLYPSWAGLREDMWPVFAVFVILLVPSYLFSKTIKLRLIHWYDPTNTKIDLRPAVVGANRLSCLVLAIAGCLLLYRFYSRM